MKLDTLEDGSGVLYLHQSDLDNFRKCPEQLRLKMRDEYYDPDSDAAFIGTLTHSFIENCLHYFQDHGFWPEMDLLGQFLDEAHAELEGKWDTLWHSPHMVADLGVAKEGLSRSCAHWWANMPQQINTDKASEWLIEASFDYPISPYAPDSGPQVRLRGHVDFWDGDRIWDWKTSSLREGWRKERYDIQSTVYTWGMTKLLGQYIHDFNLAFCPRDAGKGKDFQVLPLHRTQGDWDMMIQEAMAIARMVTDLPPDQPWPLGASDWWCSARWCSEHALGRCMGSSQMVNPEAAVHLTNLIATGHKPTRHDASFDNP